MRAAWYSQLGAAEDVLELGEIPDPVPQPGEVCVRLAASGINPIDVKRRQGGRGEMEADRIVPHFDGAGTIEAVGDGVADSRVGERVWVYEGQWNRSYGTAAELITIPTELAIPLPSDVDFTLGAAIGIPAMTAYQAVFSQGSVNGQQILVTGGAGSVGAFAIQFAKLSGATVFATTSNDEKAAVAKSCGADHVFNYRDPDVSRQILAKAEGPGIDQIVEVEFGGNLEVSLEVLRIGGVIATYASQANPNPSVPFYQLMYKNLLVDHVLVFLMRDQLKQQAIADITRWLGQGSLQCHQGAAYPLSEIVAAHQAVENGTLGKVIIDLE